MKNLRSDYTKSMEIKEFIGTKLRAIRVSKKLSAKKLGAKVGVTGKHIYDIEKNRRGASVKLINKIAESLSVRVSDLTDDSQKVQSLPVSSAVKAIASIPDEVYELALKVGPDLVKWKHAISALQHEVEKLEAVSRKEEA
jgi:transcriptional regulator with XRE-family HTH domain